MDDPAIVGWADGYEDYNPGSDVDLQWQRPEKALEFPLSEIRRGPGDLESGF